MINMFFYLIGLETKDVFELFYILMPLVSNCNVSSRENQRKGFKFSGCVETLTDSP